MSSTDDVRSGFDGLTSPADRAHTAAKTKPLISVIIPVRNEGERIALAVRSIAEGRSREFPLEIVLVDDASSDGCCGGLDRLGHVDDCVILRTLRLQRWSGVPFARNVGAAAATAPILFITDANVIFPQNWDIPIRQRLGDGEHLALRRFAGTRRVLCAAIADASSKFVGYGCTLRMPSMGVDWLTNPDVYGGHVPVSPCTGTILPAELFRRAGGYDTAMPIYGAAEPEFSIRLWLSGAEIFAAPELVLQHRFRSAAERRPFLDSIALVQLCNYLRFGLLYLNSRQSAEMIAYYSAQSPELWREALKRVTASDVRQRRKLLEERLPGKFATFAQRFSLDGEWKRSA